MTWDGESYCTADGCHEPATEEVLVGVFACDVVDDGEPFTELVELVCSAHVGGSG